MSVHLQQNQPMREKGIIVGEITPIEVPFVAVYDDLRGLSYIERVMECPFRREVTWPSENGANDPEPFSREAIITAERPEATMAHGSIIASYIEEWPLLGSL